ncbi:uncharacterized protein LOC121908855, partial [Thunnus maccoyii]|uniref:uncharacterized protein LOC121908855 n=1 Tax=Thunnus maccoyii TaxID=8240 RepID=UPI001C4B48E9
LAVILLFSALVGNTLEDDITASSAEVFSSEGRSVTLSCNYSVKADNLQWYRQDPGSAPQFLLLITDTTSPTVVNATPPHPRLTVELKTKRVDLQISSAAVSDSAVYPEKVISYLSATPVINVTSLLTRRKTAGTDYFFWYRQYPGKPPEFLISHSGTGSLISDPVPRLSFNVSADKTQMDLQISSAAVTDSALYYCAVRPTVTAKGHIIK